MNIRNCKTTEDFSRELGMREVDLLSYLFTGPYGTINMHVKK